MLFEYLYKLVDIKAHVVIGEFGIKAAEVGVVHVFEDKGGCFALLKTTSISNLPCKYNQFHKVRNFIFRTNLVVAHNVE